MFYGVIWCWVIWYYFIQVKLDWSRFVLVWFCLLVWFGVICNFFGANQCWMVWFWCDLVQSDLVWFYSGLVRWEWVCFWCGLVWFSVVWCGLVWFGVVWCGLVIGRTYCVNNNVQTIEIKNRITKRTQKKMIIKIDRLNDRKITTF